MSSLFGRKVVAYKINKTGGGVIVGDVLIPDTTNDNAFTTTTSAAYTNGAWIADETIASNATGRVVLEGHVALVNVNASVTRGHFGATHTVVKQAADAGANRTAGTFCRFTTGGATPEADIYPVDLLGTSLTNPMTAVGDIIQGTTAGAPAALAAPLAGKVLTGAGVTTPLVYSYPPGYEFDYVEATSGVSPTATTEDTANTVITANAKAYDGSTIIIVQFYAFAARPDSTAARQLFIYLYDDTGGGAASIGRLALIVSPAAAADNKPVLVTRRLTPSNATHTYSIRAAVNAGTGNIGAGAGGHAADMPMYIRQIKV